MSKFTTPPSLTQLLLPFAAGCPVRDLSVSATWRDEELQLVYRLEGNLDTLVWPQAGDGARRMGLWTSTCMEAFVRHPEDSSYFEVNASPSGDWQCLSLADYRAPLITSQWPKVIQVHNQPITTNCCELHLTLDTREPPFAVTDTLQLGLSAVIATSTANEDSELHYFALAHVDGAPDFHHRDTHILQLTRDSQ